MIVIEREDNFFVSNEMYLVLNECKMWDVQVDGSLHLCGFPSQFSQHL